jgi:hypothetical protein
MQGNLTFSQSGDGILFKDSAGTKYLLYSTTTNTYSFQDSISMRSGDVLTWLDGLTNKGQITVDASGNMFLLPTNAVVNITDDAVLTFGSVAGTDAAMAWDDGNQKFIISSNTFTEFTSDIVLSSKIKWSDNVYIQQYATNKMELYVTDGVNPTAVHIEPSKVEFKFDGTYAWTIDKDCFRAESSGCIQMNGLEYTTDPSFDDAGKWTLTGSHSISGGALNISSLAGTTTNDNSTLAGRDYVVRTVTTSASNVLQIKIGNCTWQTVAAIGTKYTRFTTVNTDPLVFSTGLSVYTVTDTDTYLIPSEVSRFGDVEVWGDLTVGMNIYLPSGSMTIAGLLIDQPGLPTGTPPNILEIQGSDRGVINGKIDASSIVIALGEGNWNSAAPLDSGSGGGLDFTAGTGGKSSYSTGTGGKGGSFFWETGTGGAHTLNSNHGTGGDWTIRLGASGGGTVAHGQHIIEDSTGTDLMVVDKDKGIQHYTGSTSPVETLTGTSNTLTALQSYLCLDGTSGACTATLPSAPVDGRTYHRTLPSFLTNV